jgi:transcriptional regulator with XRE-family HTH domain
MKRKSATGNSQTIDRLRERLQRLMREREMLPAELAAQATVPLSTLTRILNAEVSNPGIDVVIRLARGLGIGVDELIDEPAPAHQFKVVFESTDRVGILYEATQILYQEGINITSCIASTDGATARIRLTIETDRPDQLERIQGELKRVCEFHELPPGEDEQQGANAVLRKELRDLLDPREEAGAVA